MNRIFVFENQLNRDFWSTCNYENVVIYPDSTLHWLANYAFERPRCPGHLWLSREGVGYEKIVLISAEDNRREIESYYGLTDISFQHFPFLDEADVAEHSKTINLGNFCTGTKVLVLLCLSSPKQDKVAHQMAQASYQSDINFACLGYALTNDFMRIPRSILRMASFLMLEWFLHAVINPKRFFVKIKHY